MLKNLLLHLSTSHPSTISSESGHLHVYKNCTHSFTMTCGNTNPRLRPRLTIWTQPPKITILRTSINSSPDISFEIFDHAQWSDSSIFWISRSSWNVCSIRHRTGHMDLAHSFQIIQTTRSRSSTDRLHPRLGNSLPRTETASLLVLRASPALPPQHNTFIIDTHHLRDTFNITSFLHGSDYATSKTRFWSRTASFLKIDS